MNKKFNPELIKAIAKAVVVLVGIYEVAKKQKKKTS